MLKDAFIVLFTPLYYIGAAFAIVVLIIYGITYVAVLTLATAALNVVVFFHYLKKLLRKVFK